MRGGPRACFVSRPGGRRRPLAGEDLVKVVVGGVEIPICGSKPMSDQEILAAPAVRRLGRAGREAPPRSGPLR